MSSFKTGEVVEVVLKDDDVNEVYSIIVHLAQSSAIPRVAYPLDTSIKRIPLIGEIVLVVPTLSPNGKRGGRGSRLYYMNPVSVQLNPNNNALPNVIAPLKPKQKNQSYEDSNGNPDNSNTDDTDHDLGEGFIENAKVGSLQPFLGDVLIEGRFGHSLRFGYSPNTLDTTQMPSWASSNEEDPITILSNGRNSDGEYNKFIIESADDDLSSIWLTSTQQVPVDTDIGLASGVDEQNAFDSPSVIITSDRILLNSRKDYIILSGGSSNNQGGVNISTPSWKMDMDKLFTIIEGLAQQLTDLTSGKSTYATAVGPTGPASNMADVQQLLQDLQAMQQ
jgi:hypothetical protein